MVEKGLVSIVMGSDSDWDTMKEVCVCLDEFGISYTVQAMSAHRTPHQVAALAESARKDGVKVFIAGAGGAAHLAGVIAAHTTLPVIGVPIESPYLHGMDSLLSTVQMPPGVPVATVGIGKWGATNAGLLAAQILAISDEKLAEKWVERKEKMAKAVEIKNQALQTKVASSRKK